MARLNVFWIFTPKIVQDEPMLTSIFLKWVANNHQLAYIHYFFAKLIMYECLVLFPDSPNINKKNIQTFTLSKTTVRPCT